MGGGFGGLLDRWGAEGAGDDDGTNAGIESGRGEGEEAAVGEAGGGPGGLNRRVGEDVLEESVLAGEFDGEKRGARGAESAVDFFADELEDGSAFVAIEIVGEKEGVAGGEGTIAEISVVTLLEEGEFGEAVAAVVDDEQGTGGLCVGDDEEAVGAEVGEERGKTTEVAGAAVDGDEAEFHRRGGGG